MAHLCWVSEVFPVLLIGVLGPSSRHEETGSRSSFSLPWVVPDLTSLGPASKSTPLLSLPLSCCHGTNSSSSLWWFETISSPLRDTGHFSGSFLFHIPHPLHLAWSMKLVSLKSYVWRRQGEHSFVQITQSPGHFSHHGHQSFFFCHLLVIRPVMQIPKDIDIFLRTICKQSDIALIMCLLLSLS